MKKIRTLFKAPVMTQSGYGVHSRQLFNALIEDPLFDVHVEAISWGHTPFLTEDSECKNNIIECIKKRAIAVHNKQENYDLFIHVTIPNEFEQKGKFNIGVTAGIETDKVSHVWVNKCNEMDLIIVPSEHSRKVLCDTTVDWLNQRTGERGVLKLEKPVIVCNEGVDCSIFKPFDLVGGISERFDFEPKFNFLHVGQWGKGGFGEDRKNIANLVKYFIETFKGRRDVGLVLKLNMARNSSIDYEHTLDRLKSLKSNWKEEEVPPIYLVHGNLSNEEMAELYNHPKINAFVSFTHGEGFCGLDYTKIITEKGLKRLDEVKVGDKVLTHNKRFMPVTQELSRDYVGDMYEIETYNGANKEKITLTGNHRVCVFNKDGLLDWIPAENITKDHVLYIPKPKFESLGVIDKINILDFVEDKNICEVGDNFLGYYHSNKCFTPCKKYIVVDERFGKILGYYLSEGSYGSGTIHFSLHKDEEKTIVREIVESFKSVFGLESYRISIDGNKLDLSFNSKIVGLFLKSFCGEDAKTKFINPDVFRFPCDSKMNLISSLILGDGYVKEKNSNSSVEISLTNDKILRSIRVLLLEEGILSNFDFFNRKGIIKEQWSYDSDIERLRITQVDSFNLFVGWLNKNHDFVDIPLHESKYITRGRKKSWIDKDNCLFEIKNINKINYEGRVYNLSVEKDESYCTENFVVHNCLPLIEAAACGLPIIATNWSGHLDFLKKGKFSAVKYDMKEIPESAVWGDVMIKGSRWAEVQEEDAKHRMKKMVSSYSKPKDWAKDLAVKIEEEFNVSAVGDNFVDTVKMSMTKEQSAAKINPVEFLQRGIDTPDDFNVLYTMPMSAGDVFISTAVIDGLVKEIPKGSKLYFATQDKYSGILKNNPHVHKVIPWLDFMTNVEILEEAFDLVLTPNVTTQFTFSNYVRRGQGRLLAEEFANHCICELGEYHIEKEPLEDELPHEYMTIHPSSGKGQWEARNYIEWPEIVKNLKSLYPELPIVQVGTSDEPKIKDTLDFRGKTNYQQLATVIEGSELHLTIDTFSMHLAAALSRPVVALFGSSYSQSSGPWVKDREKSKIILLESEKRLGCSKACYKYQCKVNKAMPCINEIDPKAVLKACAAILQSGYGNECEKFEDYSYQRVYGKISGYTTAYNLKGYPFVESIKSMLGFCDEVVVVDGESDDGTWEVLEKLAEEDDRVQLYQNKWDFDEPGMDGLQKGFARALCQHEFLWQQDGDEVVHEKDYEKIKMITKRFPSEADILHLPVIEIWGNPQYVTGRRHSWKWRMSKNNPEITHGINKDARLTDEKTGKVYSKPGMSDGCEYVNAMTYEMLPHVGFYNSQIELSRIHAPEHYIPGINEVFEMIPSVFHYSWCSLEGKIRNFTEKWDKQWNCLYQTDNVERFPEVKTEEQIKEVAQKLFDEGGEESDQVKYKFKLTRSNPAIMKDWLSKVELNEEK